METVNFGTFLKEERERRHVSLAELARTTKLSVSALKLMEEGNLDDLPPDVFVRGFIRSYAKTLGISSSEPLGLLDQILSERRRAAEPPLVTASRPSRRHGLQKSAPAQIPVAPVEQVEQVEYEGQSPRHGIGLAVFVIIVLLIATITLSLFLRQQPQSGEGLSLDDGVASSVATPRRT
jgi:cytoskeletal protein RodZ